MPVPSDLLKRLPQVEKLVQQLEQRPEGAAVPRPVLLRAARETLEAARRAILDRTETVAPAPEALLEDILTRARDAVTPHQIRVLNATGVILHTNLGRAVLSSSVVDRIADMMKGYSLLEMDRQTGKRTKRDLLVADLLCEITGAEAATVVNNNAAATHIILHTLAHGREVICSHAHLVGIGGSFRLPDCMREAGVTLRTVGATNHCLAADYERGINENTGMLLQVHTSNYQIVGFTKFASAEELIALGRKHRLPVVYDLGSGALVDVSRYGYRGRRVSDFVDLGFDLVCFSGDKLLGGPQAGIIVGRRDAVEAIRKSPYYRIMRPDKVTLALLEYTLRLYRDPEAVDRDLPVLGMIRRTVEDLRPTAEALAGRLRAAAPAARIEVFEDRSEVGGGSLSNQIVPTVCVGIRPSRDGAEALARRLRLGDPSVIVRISEDQVVVDVRTLLAGEEDLVCDAVLRAL
jgi:L-seryl-tRNA(Ser) seleniumtransferase